MDELEREVKIYGEVDRVIHALQKTEASIGSALARDLTDAVNYLSIMRDELRRSDLTIKDLKAGVK